jgi:hypothetical protein
MASAEEQMTMAALKTWLPTMLWGDPDPDHDQLLELRRSSASPRLHYPQ